MLGLEGGEELSAITVVLLVAWAVPPALFLGYARQARAVRRTRSEFTLCRSEAAELNRAIRLFDQARGRLEELQRPSSTRWLWPVLLNLDADSAADPEERHDLEAYAAHLQATIRQLKRRPLQRLRSWVRLISTHDALAGAITVYFIGLAFTVTASNFLEEVSLFLANGAVAALAAMAALLIYPASRRGCAGGTTWNFTRSGAWRDPMSGRRSRKWRRIKGLPTKLQARPIRPAIGPPCSACRPRPPSTISSRPTRC